MLEFHTFKTIRFELVYCIGRLILDCLTCLSAAGRLWHLFFFFFSFFFCGRGFLSPVLVQVQCCFTSTETIRTIRDEGEGAEGLGRRARRPLRLSSHSYVALFGGFGGFVRSGLLFVHRDHKDY